MHEVEVREMAYSIENQEILCELKEEMLYEYKNIASIMLAASKKFYCYKKIEESLDNIKKEVANNFLSSLNTINIEEKIVSFCCSVKVNKKIKLEFVFCISKSNFYKDLECHFFVELFYDDKKNTIYDFRTEVHELNLEIIKFLFFSCLDRFENKIKEDKASYEKYYEFVMQEYQEAKSLAKKNVSKYRLDEKVSYYRNALFLLENIEENIKNKRWEVLHI